jgi:hypothetical protein
MLARAAFGSGHCAGADHISSNGALASGGAGSIRIAASDNATASPPVIATAGSRVPRFRARFAAVLLGRLTRLLGLWLLVLCTLVPADVRARMAEACRESDDCACRRGQHPEPEPRPTLRRVDCCAAPCEIDVTSTSATVAPARDIADASRVTLLPDTTFARPVAISFAMARRGGRDPPRRIHALVERWLV